MQEAVPAIPLQPCQAQTLLAAPSAALTEPAQEQPWGLCSQPLNPETNLGSPFLNISASIAIQPVPERRLASLKYPWACTERGFVLWHSLNLLLDFAAKCSQCGSSAFLPLYFQREKGLKFLACVAQTDIHWLHKKR